MADIKKYSIQINGLTESIDAVKSLNEQLSNLESRIKALSSSSVKVGTSSGGGSKTSSSSALNEEEKLLKQINQLEEKQVAYSKEIYQNYLAAKDVLKETVNDQKQLAAAERVQANTYSNTMEGIKQKLADLKSVHFTTDISTDEFKNQTKDINALTEKLKQLEQEYGVFSRNVGNYASAFGKYKVEVGGVVREFDTAKQAAKVLSNELLNLPKGAAGAEELRAALQQVKSEIQDIGKSSVAMDNLLDTMEGFAAVANVGQGIRGLFGVDDAEMQKSIKNLVALQNVLKGIETLNKQINTREGIGAWIAPFNSQIDKATAKTLVFNRALLGTGTAAKTASVAIKGFSKALKVAFSAGVLIVIDLLIDGFMKLIDSFKKVDEEAERTKEVQKDLAEAYGQAQGKLMQYKTKVDSFNGSKKQEKKLVEELNREFGSTLGTYKSLSQWQDVLKKKGDAYIQTLVNQAKAQAALNEVTAAYMNLENVRQKAANGDYSHWYQSRQQDAEAAARAIEEANQRITKAEENLKKTVTDNEKFAKTNGLGDYAPTIEKNGKKSSDAAKKAQEDITKKSIDAMKDGLNKTLMQLDEERRQTINKIRENGVKVQELVKQTEETYTQLRLKAISDYLDKLTKTVDDSAKKIAGIRFQLDMKDIELQINKIDELIRSFTEDVVPINNTLTTKVEYQAQAQGIKQDDLYFANAFNYERNKAKTEKEIKEYYKWLDSYVSTLSEEIKEKLGYMNLATGELEIDYGKVEEYIEEHYKRELNLLSSYGYQENATMSSSFAFRLNALKAYYKDYIEKINDALDEEQNLKIEAAAKEQENLLKQNDENYRIEMNSLNLRKTEIEDALKAIEKINTASTKALSESFKKSHDEEIKNLEETNGIKIKTYEDYYKSLKMSLEKNLKKTNEQLPEIEIQHADKMQQITDESGQKIIQIENEINAKRQQNTQRYYDQQLSNYRDFLSKINTEASKQPVTDKAGWGIVNIVQTKRNYKEILESTKQMFLNIKEEKKKLNDDWKKGLISPENYNSTLNQLNDIETETKQTAQTVGNNLKMVNANFVQSIQMYLQEALNSFNTIMDAVWNAEDTAFDKEQEQLDKTNDALADALDKQKEIVEQHKSAIDDIENELATARGDRRQHLIDQINAEIAAQRAAQKEEQRIKKQQEAQEKKQEELDKKRKKAEYQRQILQAIVNGAMAVTYAAMNSWPIPAIPLMAAAGAATAAQVAIMTANKPYRVGGQLEGGLVKGKRHTQGGVPVGNTGIEVEGDEMIIRRESTMPNIELLDFINKSQKRIDLDDMIEFYSSGKIKKTIQKMTPKTKFADGGTLPSLSYNYDLNDRLITAFEDYSKRPVVVSVTEILNTADSIRRVETLAGLTPSSI